MYWSIRGSSWSLDSRLIWDQRLASDDAMRVMSRKPPAASRVRLLSPWRAANRDSAAAAT